MSIRRVAPDIAPEIPYPPTPEPSGVRRLAVIDPKGVVINDEPPK